MIGFRRSLVCGLLLGLIPLVSIAATQVRERDPNWVAPPEAAARANPLANRPDAVPGGRKLFERRCTTCHGDDGRGTSKGPDLTQAAVQAQPDGELFWKITGGNSRAGMPAFSFLPEAQRWQLVLRLRTLSAEPRTPRHAFGNVTSQEGP